MLTDTQQLSFFINSVSVYRMSFGVWVISRFQILTVRVHRFCALPSTPLGCGVNSERSRQTIPHFDMELLLSRIQLAALRPSGALAMVRLCCVAGTLGDSTAASLAFECAQSVQASLSIRSPRGCLSLFLLPVVGIVWVPANVGCVPLPHSPGSSAPSPRPQSSLSLFPLDSFFFIRQLPQKL